MEHVVYILSDPRTGMIRYVGKTCRGVVLRLKEHMLPKKLSPKTHKNHWLKQLYKRGLTPVAEVVEECLDKISASEAERFWISQLRAWGFKLTNATDGGEGTTGHRFKLSSGQCVANGARKRGKRLSIEHRQKLSAATKGRPKKPFTPEHRANIAAARRGIKMPERSQSYREKISKRMKKSVIDQFGTIYESGRLAAKKLGLRECCISDVLNGRQKTTGGYVFKRV